MRATFIIAVFLWASQAVLAAQSSPEEEADALAMEFVSLLKPQLKQAMDDGGPANAIAVCADLAPGIAETLSRQSGWLVERVSLNSRNASRGIPDAWQQAVLMEFDKRQASGENASDMRFGELVGGHYRYMRAQAVEPLCLMCHGTGLSDEVQNALRQYYPDDRATGYRLGQVRGAISLSRAL